VPAWLALGLSFRTSGHYAGGQAALIDKLRSSPHRRFLLRPYETVAFEKPFKLWLLGLGEIVVSGAAVGLEPELPPNDAPNPVRARPSGLPAPDRHRICQNSESEA